MLKYIHRIHQFEKNVLRISKCKWTPFKNPNLFWVLNGITARWNVLPSPLILSDLSFFQGKKLYFCQQQRFLGINMPSSNFLIKAT